MGDPFQELTSIRHFCRSSLHVMSPCAAMTYLRFKTMRTAYSRSASASAPEKSRVESTWKSGTAIVAPKRTQRTSRLRWTACSCAGDGAPRRLRKRSCQEPTDSTYQDRPRPQPSSDLQGTPMLADGQACHPPPPLPGTAGRSPPCHASSRPTRSSPLRRTKADTHPVAGSPRNKGSPTTIVPRLSPPPSLLEPQRRLFDRFSPSSIHRTPRCRGYLPLLLCIHHRVPL